MIDEAYEVPKTKIAPPLDPSLSFKLTSNVIDVDAESWEEEVLRSDVLTVVEFWHENCPRSAMFNPVFEEVAEEYRGKVKFVKVNVLRSPKNMQVALRNGALSTPVVAFYGGGRCLGMITGFVSREPLRSIIENAVKEHKKQVKAP